MNTRLLALAAAFLLPSTLSAADAVSGPLTLSVSNGTKRVAWPRVLIPALETNKLSVGASVTAFTEIPASLINPGVAGYSYSVSNALGQQFFALTQAQMSSNALLTANVLNRLAYGPTPDELERVAAIGPQAYIDEQLQPQNLPNTPDTYVVHTTNGVSQPPDTGWNTVTVTGRVTSSTLYIYMPAPGDAYLDNVQLSVIYTNYVYITNNSTGVDVITTNAMPYLGTNVVRNGDFEMPLANGWVKSGGNFLGSDVVSTPVESGLGSLHLVSIGPVGGNYGNGNALTQSSIPGLASVVNAGYCVLSFSYLRRPDSGDARINIRLSGGGTIASDSNPAPPPTWIYVTATGQANATPTIYAFLNGAGEVYIDDLKLVRGSIPEGNTNHLINGDFEQPLNIGWQTNANFASSVVSNARSHAGGGSLRLIATDAGSGGGNSLFQNPVPGLTSGGPYTVSFWCTVPTQGRTLTIRLSGSLLVATAPGSSAGIANIKRRLDTFGMPSPDTGLLTARTLGGGGLADLRSWFVQNAVGSPRQLLEILSQFFENHFVTEHTKSVDYFDRFYDDGTVEEAIATDWEYREMTKWRNALLNPNCTFYDLLKIHAESPAQIVYLDTVGSRGDGNQVANENYARELFELYSMGVDNGYDQLDITAMSRAWTGWSVEIVDRENIDNPLAPQSQTFGFYPNASGSGTSNRVGTWTFNYKSANHGTNRAPILSEWTANATRTNLVYTGPKRYPARLGTPWAGRSYQIPIPRRLGTASIQDGYDVIQSLATNIFTAEYLSVKLCRVFVHDEFPNPTTTTTLPEYAYYNYTDPNRTAEAELVRKCIVAWDTPGSDGRKGHIRAVLRTIFDSELFRSHGGSMQKVKTPLEFTVSAIRALRSANANGTFTASTDGFSISGRSRGATSSPLVRMGTMRLFDRDAPDGYPEVAAPWISAGTLAERIRFIQTTLMDTADTNKSDNISGGNNNLTDPVALLKNKLPNNGSWNNAGAVADFFLRILYPGEGRANLDLYRQNAINFLNASDDGAGSSAFSVLSNTGGAGSPYDIRVRATVAMLMTLQRFHEQ
jgi:uncharacterized protein (DUF1800 family)